MRKRFCTDVAEPSAPTSDSVWQPEQWSRNSTAPAWYWLDLATPIPCDPQALTPTAIPSAATALRAIFATRLMRAQMIRIMLAQMLKATRPLLGAACSRGRALLLAAALAALAGGCGAGPATQSGSLLRLRIDEYHISPESVRIHAGEIRIELSNRGVLDHEVEVSVFGGTRLYVLTPTARPGHVVFSRLFSLRPGTYRLFDPTANYADLGAYGTLAVLPRGA